MENAKLSPPWITFMNEIKALFVEDPDIKIQYSEDDYTMKLFVDNTDKAEALSKMIPAEKDFGNVKMKIEIVPANKDDMTYADLLKKAFAGNPVVKDVVSVDTPFGKVTYVVFEKKVVQFFNDQMDDLYGNKSTLYQECARDVFETKDADAFFCTDNGLE